VSEVMSRLILEMREKFDVIIIDSPPLVAGMGCLCARCAAGSMLIVLRPAVTIGSSRGKARSLDRCHSGSRRGGERHPDGRSYEYYAVITATAASSGARRGCRNTRRIGSPGVGRFGHPNYGMPIAQFGSL